MAYAVSPAFCGFGSSVIAVPCSIALQISSARSCMSAKKYKGLGASSMVFSVSLALARPPLPIPPLSLHSHRPLDRCYSRFQLCDGSFGGVFDILGQQLPEFLDQRGLSFVVPTCWAILLRMAVAFDLTKGLVQGQIRIDCEFDSVGGEQHVVVSGPLREVTVSFEPWQPLSMSQLGFGVVQCLSGDDRLLDDVLGCITYGSICGLDTSGQVFETSIGFGDVGHGHCALPQSPCISGSVSAE